MGLFSSVNTWRAPLQLIDCWLPEPARPQPVTTRPVAAMPSSAALKRFSRAGWLGRPAANAPRADIAPTTARTVRGCTRSARHDGRVVLSGRIDDVCAALDRLAAGEQAAMPRTGGA